MACTADSACEGYSGRSRVSFTQKQIDESNGSGDACANKVIPVDLDDDGDIDLLTSCKPYNKILWYENLDGQGTFSDRREIATGVEVYNVYAADLDGDGNIDVVSGSKTTIAWYKNDGQGTFSTHQISTAVNRAYDVYATDLDGDGLLDVLSASASDDKIAWYKNEGQGAFSSQKVITTGAEYTRDVYAADLDGDGDMDVLSGDDNKVAWYENDGQGTFIAEKTIAAEPTYTTYAADVDGDGDLDVLVAGRLKQYVNNPSTSEIAWYENLDGQGTFSGMKVITTDVTDARDVYAADLDNDGDMDVFSADYEDDIIAWYENLDGQGTFSDQKVIENQFNKESSSLPLIWMVTVFWML